MNGSRALELILETLNVPFRGLSILGRELDQHREVLSKALNTLDQVSNALEQHIKVLPSEQAVDDQPDPSTFSLEFFGKRRAAPAQQTQLRLIPAKKVQSALELRQGNGVAHTGNEGLWKFLVEAFDDLSQLCRATFSRSPNALDYLEIVIELDEPAFPTLADLQGVITRCKADRANSDHPSANGSDPVDKGSTVRRNFNAARSQENRSCQKHIRHAQHQNADAGPRPLGVAISNELPHALCSHNVPCGVALNAWILA